MKKNLLTLILWALITSMLVISPAAAEYPSKKPITVYIPLSAGGTTDVFVRTITPYIEKALEVVAGNKLKAAELLGINYTTFRYRLEKLNISK